MELLRTERLVLRHWEQSDLDAFFGLYSRDDVARWLGPHPRRPVATREEARDRLRRWQERGSGLSAPLGRWAIVPVTAGAPPGPPTGTPPGPPAGTPPGQPAGTLLLMPLTDGQGATGLVEVGWHLHPDHQGQGLATEAARAVLARAAAAGIAEVLALTDLDNAASQRVAARLGMRDEGVTQRWFGLTTRQYRKALTPPGARDPQGAPE